MPRTGNQSLKYVLEDLGYSVVHFPTRIELLDEYDAGTEVAFPINQVTRRYPYAIFLLTVRNIDDWFNSCMRVRESGKVQKNWNPFWFKKPGVWKGLFNKRFRFFLHYTADVPQNASIINICDRPDDAIKSLYRKLKVPVEKQKFDTFPRKDAVFNV